MSKLSPFDIINHISLQKTSLWDDIDEKDYNSFMINRGLSYYLDCIMHSNEMNSRYSLPKSMQYAYLQNAIEPKKKRFSKWASSKKDSEVSLVSEHYQISLQKASAIHKLLSAQEIESISKKMYKGGMS